MDKILPLGEFLRRNQRFAFNLPDFLESTRYESELRERFHSFCRTFRLAAEPDGGWAAARGQVRELVAGVPAYDGIDWERERYQDSIPLIDKTSLRTAPDSFVSPAFDRSRLWSRETSGTTGPPVQIWYTPEFAFDHMFLSPAKGLVMAGRFTEEVRGAAVFYLSLMENKYLRDRAWGYPGDFLNVCLQATFDERRRSSARRAAALVERYRPACLLAKPNVLESLLGSARACRWEGRRRPAAILSSGADLAPGLRRDAQAYFEVPIYNAYGLTETGIVAAECGRQEGLHVYEHGAVVEVLGEDGRLSTTGAGELVVSSLGNRAMPLLRYRTGDIAEVTGEPCGCGAAGRRIRSLSGRIIRNFRLPDGSEVSPFNWNRFFDRFPIREFRLTQSAPERVLLEVEFLPSCPDPASTLATMRREVLDGMRGLVSVHAEVKAFPAGDKFQRYRPLPEG